MPKAKPYYITMAIAYANAKPHIGYALECLYTDVLARYFRLQGREVFFLTGTDEHGQKIVRAAKNAGQQPKDFVDEMVLRFQALREVLNLSSDIFTRTTTPDHAAAAQDLWRRCLKTGDIYKKIFQGLYCVGCESFKTEKELVEGKCPDHKVVPEMIEEENYFFRLSKYTNPLLELYTKNPNFVYPETKFNEIISLVRDEGLEDISISRSKDVLSWGVPVPDDPGQVMYVWFDALTVYLSGVGYPEGDWNNWWPANVQIVGKEINRFHSALWPAMLMSAGLELPNQVAVHGWITVDGQKMSKSIGNVLDPVALVEQYGVEPVRYFLLREIPFERDGDFSHRRFRDRYTADLANDLGNLLSRTTTMIEKYFAGKLDPKIQINPDIAVIHSEAHLKVISQLIETLRFDLALEKVWHILDEGNGLIEREKPWVLAKFDTDRLHQVLYQLVIYLEAVATALTPFMPETAHKIQHALGQDVIHKAEPLFPRLPEEETTTP
ncbi:MAG: methionine--tRNA ligase [Patescibacteria group bacterium]